MHLPRVRLGERASQAAAGCARFWLGDMRALTAGAPPAAVTIERVEEELGWDARRG